MHETLAMALARELREAPWGTQQEVLRRWAGNTGLSISSLHRAARQAGYQPQPRKARADAGQSRGGISDEACLYLVALLAGSRRKTGRVEMPTTVAVEICQRAGLLPEEVSVEAVRRRLRCLGQSRRAIQTNWTTDNQTAAAAHGYLKSDHPNHLHEVDVSACLHWYFKKTGGMAMLHKNLELAGGKKAAPYKKLREHILRYVLVDHFSGAFYVRYYYAAGETPDNLLDHMHHAWRRREHPRDLLHGVPRMVYFDAGAANLAYMTANLLDSLGVEWEAHQPGNSRATGLVESMMSVWQQQFESRLWLEPPRDLEELNARADDHRIYYSARKVLDRTGMTRWAGWSGIRADQLRLVPPREIYNELIHERPHQTKVPKDKIVRWKGALHLITDDLNVGEPILVMRNPYKLPELQIHRVREDGRPGAQVRSQYITSVAEIATPVGEYRRHADAPVQRAVKAAADLDLTPVREAAFSGWAEELPPLTYLERAGEEIVLEAPEPPRPLSLTEALRQVREALGWHRISPLQNQALAKRLGQTPTPAQVRDLIRDLQTQAEGEAPAGLAAAV